MTLSHKWKAVSFVRVLRDLEHLQKPQKADAGSTLILSTIDYSRVQQKHLTTFMPYRVTIVATCPRVMRIVVCSN